MANKEIVPWIEPVTPSRRVKQYTDFEKMCIVEYIIEEVENGGNVIKASADCDCDPRNFYNWIKTSQEWMERFAAARDMELLHAYEKIVDVERRLLLGIDDKEWVHPKAAAAALNSIFWRLERRKRDVYGREIKHVHGVEDYEAKLANARERMEKLLAGGKVVINHVAE